MGSIFLFHVDVSVRGRRVVFFFLHVYVSVRGRWVVFFFSCLR